MVAPTPPYAPKYLKYPFPPPPIHAPRSFSKLLSLLSHKGDFFGSTHSNFRMRPTLVVACACLLLLSRSRNLGFHTSCQPDPSRQRFVGGLSDLSERRRELQTCVSVCTASHGPLDACTWCAASQFMGFGCLCVVCLCFIHLPSAFPPPCPATPLVPGDR